MVLYKVIVTSSLKIVLYLSSALAKCEEEQVLHYD